LFTLPAELGQRIFKYWLHVPSALVPLLP
jgi:hypothetical protein